jgi:polysaccharide export outer membrane protein
MRWLHLFLLVMLLPLAACSINGAPDTILSAPGRYSIDGGDVLKVSVYGDDSLSRSYKVDESGHIAFPLVGPISVRGLSTAQAAADIAAGLARGFMRHPDVSVEVDTYRPFYIQGGVKQAGQFAFVPGMTVRAAISTAGGFTDATGPRRATIYRHEGDTVRKGSVGLDFPILPGDTITVGGTPSP